MRTLAHIQYFLNPFLFINRLCWPHCVQASLSLNCLKLTTVYADFLTFSLLYHVVTVALNLKHRSNSSQGKSGHKVPLLPHGLPCHAASFPAGWSGRMLKPAHCNDRLARFFLIWTAQNGHYRMHWAVIPDTASSNWIKVRQTGVASGSAKGQRILLIIYNSDYFWWKWKG